MLLEDLCESIKKDGHDLPVQPILKAATEGWSTSVLELLFAEGAKIDSSMDVIPVNSADRSMDFFRTLAAHGWPKGPRGLANNLQHGGEVVRLLIERGAKVDVPCLKEAVRIGDVQVVEYLMSQVDLRVKIPTIHDYMKAMSDPEYWQAQEMCSEQPSLKRIVDQAGLLQIAAHHQHLDLVRFMLEKGATLDLIPDREQAAEGVNGCALHKVVAGCSAGRIPQPDIVRALLDAGANANLKDEVGRTALEISKWPLQVVSDIY